MKKLNQSGFSGIEIALTILIIGLIGGSGYLVYQRQQDKKEQDTLQKQVDELKKQGEDSGNKESNSSSGSQESQDEDSKILAAVKIENAGGGFDTCETEGVTCTIQQQTDKLALVGWGVAEGGGANVFLSKEGQDWTIIYSGNDSVPESVVQKYDIPQSWLGPSI